MMAEDRSEIVEIVQRLHKLWSLPNPSESDLAQMRVYLEAYALYLERNAVYEDLWKDYGWMDTLTHVRSKALRLVRKFWRDDPQEENDDLLDDALDLINYCVFFIRNFRSRNKWGRS